MKKIFMNGQERNSWEFIRKMPQDKNNYHESLFKSFHVLKEVERMLDRGDSGETVLMFINYMYLSDDSMKSSYVINSEKREDLC